jgi:hypothetical protein
MTKRGQEGVGCLAIGRTDKERDLCPGNGRSECDARTRLPDLGDVVGEPVNCPRRRPFGSGSSQSVVDRDRILGWPRCVIRNNTRADGAIDGREELNRFRLGRRASVSVLDMCLPGSWHHQCVAVSSHETSSRRRVTAAGCEWHSGCDEKKSDAASHVLETTAAGQRFPHDQQPIDDPATMEPRRRPLTAPVSRRSDAAVSGMSGNSACRGGWSTKMPSCTR